MTRDSNTWWLVIAGAVLTALSGHFELLHKAFPVMPAWVDAQIELLSLLIGVVSGVMRMSPLPISDEGRQKAISEQANSADHAAQAAAIAASASAQAAKSADVAVKAASVASSESTKAANTVE